MTDKGQTESETDEVDVGQLRPDGPLTRVFRGVARDELSDQYGAVKAAGNHALLMFLARADPDSVEYHLSREGFDSLGELREAVRQRQSAPFPEMEETNGGHTDE